MPSELQPELLFPPARTIWTVSALLARVRQSLEREYFNVWLEGEISNLKISAARHIYFTLKDDSGQIRAVYFAQFARLQRFRLQDGLQVLVRCRISIYEARGDLQCYVEVVEPRGQGGLQLAFEQLKAKLAAEGLFAAERKRPLPTLPRRLGLITSPRGAVIADMLHILQRRFPNLELRLFPVQVQGEAAAGEICQALAHFAEMSAWRPDVLILGRGGGSLEDLWPFNDERVARAIAASPIPVISAVGHETDFTIADFVADLRAPTPSAAAELVVRAKQDFIEEGTARRLRLVQAMRYSLLQHRHDLADLTRHRAFETVRSRLSQSVQQLDDLTFRLRHALERHMAQRRRQLDIVVTRIQHHDVRARLTGVRQTLTTHTTALLTAYRLDLTRRSTRLSALRSILVERNPLALLQRGYALVFDAQGRLVVQGSALVPGDILEIRFVDGQIAARVEGRKQ
ncbi:MAG: exodeoxyribonuclease VII large subunit [Terriglobales bacterium]